MIKFNVIKVKVKIADSKVKKFQRKNLNMLSSFFARSDFCCMLVTFANNLDPDQDQWNVVPDLDPNGLTL